MAKAKPHFHFSFLWNFNTDKLNHYKHVFGREYVEVFEKTSDKLITITLASSHCSFLQNWVFRKTEIYEEFIFSQVPGLQLVILLRNLLRQHCK